MKSIRWTCITLTDDHHYDVLKGIDYPPIEVIKLEDFLPIVRSLI